MTTSDVIEAIADAINARAAERRAREEYGGYSWGYVGSSLITAAQRAEEEAGRRLDALIAERVAAALQEST